MGSIMTLPRGAVVKGISFDRLAEALEKEGFTLTNGEQQKRQARLRDYIGRLHRGEEADAVREDFVQHFTDVAPEEIAAAEQELIKGGVPVREVQRLCDLHASLFEGHIESAPAAPKSGDDEVDELHPVIRFHCCAWRMRDFPRLSPILSRQSKRLICALWQRKRRHSMPCVPIMPRKRNC